MSSRKKCDGCRVRTQLLLEHMLLHRRCHPAHCVCIRNSSSHTLCPHLVRHSTHLCAHTSRHAIHTRLHVHHSPSRGYVLLSRPRDAWMSHVHLCWIHGLTWSHAGVMGSHTRWHGPRLRLISSHHRDLVVAETLLFVSLSTRTRAGDRGGGAHAEPLPPAEQRSRS